MAKENITNKQTQKTKEKSKAKRGIALSVFGILLGFIIVAVATLRVFSNIAEYIVLLSTIQTTIWCIYLKKSLQKYLKSRKTDNKDDLIVEAIEEDGEITGITVERARVN